MAKYIAVYRPHHTIGGGRVEVFDVYLDALDWLTSQPPGTKTLITWYP